MRETRLYGSVRGAAGNSRPYRERPHCKEAMAWLTSTLCNQNPSKPAS